MSSKKITGLIVALAVAGLGWATWANQSTGSESAAQVGDNLAVATFAGGCFWCMEPPYDKLDGVVSTISGFTGGPEDNPTYNDVASGRTGHTEAVQVTYDPRKIGYQQLLDVFWRNHDPLNANGQFCDRGRQYRPGIFFHDEEQQNLAEASKEKWNTSGRFDRPIVTEVTAFTKFFAAEEYHQNYYKKNPIRYKTYRFGCRRDARLRALWGKESGKE